MKVLSAFLMLAVASLQSGGKPIAGQPLPPRPIAVWCGGDDGLTQRFRDALEAALERSAGFILSPQKAPSAVKVLIPKSLEWKKVGGRTEVFYMLQVSSVNGQVVRNLYGSCWDDELSLCGKQAARRVIAKIKR